MDKFEIVTRQRHLNDLLELLESAGVEGYTTLPVRKARGLQHAEVEDVDQDTADSVLVVALCSTEVSTTVAVALRDYMVPPRGLAWASRVDFVVR